jgi:hypothetical protein
MKRKFFILAAGMFVGLALGFVGVDKGGNISVEAVEQHPLNLSNEAEAPASSEVSDATNKTLGKVSVLRGELNSQIDVIVESVLAVSQANHNKGFTNRQFYDLIEWEGMSV